MESNNSIEPEQLLSKVNPSNLGEEASNTAIAPPISGLYAWNAQQIREELRLDVDGRYPQMVASGTIISNLSSPIHWIAKLTNNGPNTWTGNIRNKFLDGVQSFPYTNVKIQVTRGSFSVQHTAEVTFLIGGETDRTRTFRFQSPYFHSVEFEFDAEEGTTPVTTYRTHSHPDKPAFLPDETLSITEVFKRTGFDVKLSEGNNIVTRDHAGTNRKWSNQELHDAMQVYWSHFDNKPQWSMWTFFANSEAERGHGLGGIMFDSIGPNHRQGTAIFNNSFISNPPQGDPNPEAWIQRNRFWTACHEMGHAFNLMHSWQKHLGNPWEPLGRPLIPEPKALSFMNYPDDFDGNHDGNIQKFFKEFEYRFSDQELLFMRHAPEHFVQMGNVNFGINHGFEQSNDSINPSFNLELRVNRKTPVFQFLEPVVFEIKLTNTSGEPQLTKKHILSDLSGMSVIVKKQGKQGRQLLPYAQYCWKLENKVIMPGESFYETVFASVGKNGWLIDEPGYYNIQVSLQINGNNIVSNNLRLRVFPPSGYDQEFLAQDFFSEEVGRILTFDGSHFLEKGNNILREVTEKLRDHSVALHAHIALAKPLAFDYKFLNFTEDSNKRGAIKIIPAQPDEARKQFTSALTEHKQIAAKTLSHKDYNEYMVTFSEFLSSQDENKEAAEVQNDLYQTLAERNVLDSVLQKIKNRRETYEQQTNK
ncbi:MULTISPECIES: hypothetical protein [unclassified Bacillus (in: firmicutes)]|uniref:hypothetical protein n=1 Tax=unclassified Bacillus (in: firmicutes) TaxID=185979 RepID=UPI00077AA71A|nr:hypothetical protein [Bacillus sp. RM2(2019)]KXY57716.1 hypothetical protein AT261_14755 [Bacillus cereus]